MNTKLKVRLEEAIEEVLNDSAEAGLWCHYIHPQLVKQMTEAAERVFDAAQDAQEYFEKENS